MRVRECEDWGFQVFHKVYLKKKYTRELFTKIICYKKIETWIKA